jgi:hypothetical protein
MMKQVPKDELEHGIGDVISIVHKDDLDQLLQTNVRAAEGKALYVIVPEAEEDKKWNDADAAIPHIRTEVILEKEGRLITVKAWMLQLGQENGVEQLDGGWEVTVAGVEDTSDVHGFLRREYADAAFYKKALEEPAKVMKQTLKELGITQMLVGHPTGIRPVLDYHHGKEEEKAAIRVTLNVKASELEALKAKSGSTGCSSRKQGVTRTPKCRWTAALSWRT